LNAAEFEIPPPGAGLDTVTVTVPGLVISLAGMFAIMCSESLKSVVLLEPFHLTVEPGTKLAPWMFRLKPVPPANTALGPRLLIAGVGLEVMKMVTSFEVPPLGEGLNTVTVAFPTEERSLPEIVAKS
jgi:hypothetical protein